jgi:hypothetical protein
MKLIRTSGRWTLLPISAFRTPNTKNNDAFSGNNTLPAIGARCKQCLNSELLCILLFKETGSYSKEMEK